MTTQVNALPFFNIFSNDGKKKERNTFRVFSKDEEEKDVVADYYVSNIDDTAKGAAIRTKSKAGKNVISVQVELNGDWWYGILSFSNEGLRSLKTKAAQPKGERAGVFGTFTNGDKVEKSASGWVKVTKKGDVYLSCTLQEPYNKSSTASDAPDSAPDNGFDDSDIPSDIPF